MQILMRQCLESALKIFKWQSPAPSSTAAPSPPLRSFSQPSPPASHHTGGPNSRQEECVPPETGRPGGIQLEKGHTSWWRAGALSPAQSRPTSTVLAHLQPTMKGLQLCHPTLLFPSTPPRGKAELGKQLTASLSHGLLSCVAGNREVEPAVRVGVIGA